MKHLTEAFIHSNSQWLKAKELELLLQIKAQLTSKGLSLEQFTDIEVTSLTVDAYVELLDQYFAKALHNELSQLKAVLAALSQIEIGLYGMCPHCENPISEARLTENPAVQSCNDCQS